MTTDCDNGSLGKSNLPSFYTLLLSSRQARQSSLTLVPPLSQQRLHKSTVSAGTELSETLLGPGAGPADTKASWNPYN